VQRSPGQADRDALPRRLDLRVYLQSDAVLNILRGLGRPLAWTYALVVVPKFLRDAADSLVANRRYSWFGARQSCRVPDGLTMAKIL
jgi:predicted DCC family thiol-disulfide oxidoreductase YuxK